MRWSERWLLALAVAAAGCDEESGAADEIVEMGAPATADGGYPSVDASAHGDAASSTAPVNAGLRYRSDVSPITQAADALPRVFIPPYTFCRAPDEGAEGGASAHVCTNVAISGATEPGRYFPDYADCDVVITQRPFWSAPPAGQTPPNDPRLADSAYMAELGWVTEQVNATGCVCCHDSKALGTQAAQWDVQLGPIWLDSLSDSGLALFAGLADSSVLGAYRPEDNNGFDRNVVGIPTTDNARMQRFMLAELARRGISEDEARAVPPFGGPIYENRVAKPATCAGGEGVDPGGLVHWNGGAARYVYVLAEGSANPGVPPNLDLPAGTLWRLDVLASAAPVASGLSYGSTPEGSFQYLPEGAPAPALMLGQTYQLTVLLDVGVPLANCLFRFGADVPPPEMDAVTSASSAPASR